MMKEIIEMSGFEKNSSRETKLEEPQNDTISRGQETKCVGNVTKVMMIFVVCSVGSVSFSVLKDPSPGNGLWTLFHFKHFKKDSYSSAVFLLADESVHLPKDKLLGGLLPQGLDEKSCLSRYQSVLYHKQQTRHPSSNLISRLRNYESLHKQCGPYTESYNRTLEYLKYRQYSGTTTDCNYVVWIANSGLGNKMLTLASAFLYALLTNRVLLVDPGEYLPDLFCEPFPKVSWLVPSDFPIIEKFNTFDQKSPQSFGNMLKNNISGNSTGSSLRPYVYLHLLHDYDNHDKLFFCDQEQTVLQKVPWLIMKSNNYFIPSLFLIQSFEDQLSNLFPEKAAVFYLLGRYLFHPTNVVWGLITRYYEAYLARADAITGIQIRTLEKGPGPFKYVLDQILACVRKENLLPEINDKKPIIYPSEKPKTKAVLITSLSSGYFEAIRDMYWEHQTATGEIIEVYQPSHEKHQHTENKMHNIKALAEIYLPSLTDKLVTSPWSTFGYVAQTLGGLKPWILFKPVNQTVPDPPCHRAMSMEPCFHAPPSHDCGSLNGVDSGKFVSNIQPCEDRSWGIKLVDKDNEL